MVSIFSKLLKRTDTVSAVTGTKPYQEFEKIVAQSIGLFPNVQTAPNSPATVGQPSCSEIALNGQSIARYIRLADLVWVTRDRRSRELLTGGISIAVGEMCVLNNQAVGIALIARGLREFVNKKLRYHSAVLEEITRNCATGMRENSIATIVNTLFPLAHAIGHHAKAQALCPSPIMSDEILETYKINYNQAQSVTGRFPYERLLTDPESPLNLQKVRREAAADFFAVTVVLSVIHRLLAAGTQFPLDKAVLYLTNHPIVAALAAICFEEKLRLNLTEKDIQELSLAARCRHSLIIDSARASAKHMFYGRSNFQEIERVIDDTINECANASDETQAFMWNAVMDYKAELPRLASLDAEGSLEYARKLAEDPILRSFLLVQLEYLIKEYPDAALGRDAKKRLTDYHASFSKGT